MSTTDFIERVRDRCGLSDTAAAEPIAVAVLTELGRHLSGPSARRLSEGLPEAFALPLRQTSETAAPGGVDEFYARVQGHGALSGLDPAAAVGGVGRALAETADAEAVDAAREQLPAPLRTLLALQTDEGDTSQQMAGGPIEPDAPNIAGPDVP
jgi:uncharacterized protein (DUF2267 family)